MGKKIKIIISSILCFFIVGIGLFLVYNNQSSPGEKKSQNFIKSINYLKEENYIEAYNNIKDSSDEEFNIIQTIILYKFIEQINLTMELNEKIYDEADNILDYLIYTYTYSKNPVYQQNIDKIYDEEYPIFFELKNKIPEEIFFQDSIDYYNLYFEYLNLNNGLFKNYEYNVLYNKQEILNKIADVKNKLNEMVETAKETIGKHPLSVIPEEYKLLFDI